MDNIFVNEESTEYSKHKDFTSLKAWQACEKVKNFFYKEVLPVLPPEEKYALNQQIRRDSVSTTANIAEGYGRYHYQEGIRFYRISRGSLYELKDHSELNYVEKSVADKSFELIEQAKKFINGFINYQKRQKNLTEQANK